MKSRFLAIVCAAGLGALGVTATSSAFAEESRTTSADLGPAESAPPESTPTPTDSSQSSSLVVEGTFEEIVASAEGVAVDEALPDDLRYIETLVVPGSDVEQKVYATDAYIASRTDPKVPMGPVVVIAVTASASGLDESEPAGPQAASRTLTSGETVEITFGPNDATYVSVTDGDVLVQAASTNYSTEETLDFVEAMAR